MENYSAQTNRAFLFGDAVFETFKVINKKILFLEDHYFRLMSSMRILRMEIPMKFTMEFLNDKLLNTIKSLNNSNAYRIRITVFRNSEGLYFPESNEIDFSISVSDLESSLYQISSSNYEIDIYKDFYISKQLLSNLKTTNRIINITGSIYAKENNLNNCILLNEERNVVEVLNGNIFMLKDNTLTTPPLSDGCIKGVMRKQILGLAKELNNIKVEEKSISPFELQKADELFTTNVIHGIQPITKFRKKEYDNKIALQLLKKLNSSILIH